MTSDALIAIIGPADETLLVEVIATVRRGLNLPRHLRGPATTKPWQIEVGAGREAGLPLSLICADEEEQDR